MNETMPGMFTVVMTVFEREYYVPHAIESVAWQTHENWELLIYADGPHPATRYTVSDLRQKRPELRSRVRYVEQLANPGGYGNLLRQQGLSEARGEYICFLPHDCLYHPRYLSTHVAALESSLCVSVVKSRHWGWPDLARAELPLFCGSMPVDGVPVCDVRSGQIDLCCLGFSTSTARGCDIFSSADADRVAADYLAFDKLRQDYPVVESSEFLAAHF